MIRVVNLSPFKVVLICAMNRQITDRFVTQKLEHFNILKDQLLNDGSSGKRSAPVRFASNVVKNNERAHNFVIELVV